MRAASFCLALLALSSLASLAFPTYPAEIPNGVKLLCLPLVLLHLKPIFESSQQCDLDLCKAVGHLDCRGGEFPNAQGEFLNAFGQAFVAAGRQWTTELCNADSDGDGKTNGEELGDPCCVWQPAGLPTMASDYRISHPGHAEDVTDSPGPTSAECQALLESQGGAAAFDEAEWVAGLYNEGEVQSNFTFRVQEHTLPSNETIYTRIYFPLMQDQDYYIVGFLADIVNKVHVHHFVVQFCTAEFSDLYWTPNRTAGYPENPFGPDDTGYTPQECQQNLYNWAPGGDTFALPKNMAIKFGQNTEFKSLLLEIHYNNPEGATDAIDTSGFTALVTTTPRDHEATWWWTGSIIAVGTIPPGKEAYFNTAECTVELRPECDEIKAVGYAPHAHFLGSAIWTEHYRPDKYGALTYVGEVGREDAYNYELQYSRFFDEEVTIKHGDMVSATCIYDSSDKTVATPGGLASQQEMCINFVLMYPATCLYSTQCTAVGRIVSGDVPATSSAPHQTPNLYSVGGSPNFTAIASDGMATCDIVALMNNSLVGVSGDPSERVIVSFGENCPGIFSSGENGGRQLAPETALTYRCMHIEAPPQGYPHANVTIGHNAPEYQNLESHIIRQAVQEYAQILAAGQGHPGAFAPPSCYTKMTKRLVEEAGGTYRPVQAGELQIPDEASDPVITIVDNSPPLDEKPTPSGAAPCSSSLGLGIAAVGAFLLLLV